MKVPGGWDNLTKDSYDLTLDQFPTNEILENIYKKEQARGYYVFGDVPDSQFFDLTQKVQPNSKRWDTDNCSETPSSFDEFLIGRIHESLFWSWKEGKLDQNTNRHRHWDMDIYGVHRSNSKSDTKVYCVMVLKREIF